MDCNEPSLRLNQKWYWSRYDLALLKVNQKIDWIGALARCARPAYSGAQAHSNICDRTVRQERFYSNEPLPTAKIFHCGNLLAPLVRQAYRIHLGMCIEHEWTNERTVPCHSAQPHRIREYVIVGSIVCIVRCARVRELHISTECWVANCLYSIHSHMQANSPRMPWLRAAFVV